MKEVASVILLSFLIFIIIIHGNLIIHALEYVTRRFNLIQSSHHCRSRTVRRFYWDGIAEKAYRRNLGLFTR